jgi:hypothetical protein
MQGLACTQPHLLHIRPSCLEKGTFIGKNVKFGLSVFHNFDIDF